MTLLVRCSALWEVWRWRSGTTAAGLPGSPEMPSRGHMWQPVLNTSTCWTLLDFAKHPSKVSSLFPSILHSRLPTTTTTTTTTPPTARSRTRLFPGSFHACYAICNCHQVAAVCTDMALCMCADVQKRGRGLPWRKRGREPAGRRRRRERGGTSW
jgi:hypothetical protein